jgi:hypothetical protein
MIWDDHQNRCIGELAFRSDVRAVRLRRDRVVVALAQKVYVYNFADLTLLDHIETCDNPRGACACARVCGPPSRALPPPHPPPPRACASAAAPLRRPARAVRGAAQ